MIKTELYPNAQLVIAARRKSADRVINILFLCFIFLEYNDVDQARAKAIA